MDVVRGIQALLRKRSSLVTAAKVDTRLVKRILSQGSHGLWMVPFVFPFIFTIFHLWTSLYTYTCAPSSKLTTSQYSGVGLEVCAVSSFGLKARALSSI